MKLLLDEMWPPGVALQMRRRGHDVVAVSERPELRGRPDATIFSAARAEERAVVTENVIDCRLLAAYALQTGQSHPGLVFTSNRRFPRHDPRTIGRLVSTLDELLSARPEMTNGEHWLT